MSFWNSILFGIIQGITEFFPVSSSAHLSILFNLFGVTTAGYNAKMFSVFLHFGTVLAALIFYWKDFGEIVLQVFDFAAASSNNAGNNRKSYSGVRMLVMMLFASIPLAMLLPFNQAVSHLNENSLLIGIMLVLSGTVLYISGQFREGKKTEKNMEISDAILIGLCQIVAAIPGLSRTGIVMTAAIAVGCRKEFSFRYTVMLSVPVMFIANIVHLVEATSGAFRFADLPLCLVGTSVAFVSGMISLKFLSGLIKKKDFSVFSYYSWVAGIIFIILTMIF